MSGVRVKDVSGLVANIAVAVGIVSPSHGVQSLFPLSVTVAAILNSAVSQRLKMSGNVNSVIFMSGLSWYISLNRVVISSRSKVIAASVLTSAILDFRYTEKPDFSAMAALKSPYRNFGASGKGVETGFVSLVSRERS